MSHRQVPGRVATRVLRKVVTEMRAVAVEAFEWKVRTWAKRAGVHESTAYNLISGRTRFPRFETVVRMAHAVKLEITPLSNGAVVLKVAGTDEFDHTITPEGRKRA